MGDSNYKLVNREEVDNWLFHHSNTLGNTVVGIKDPKLGMNVSFKDTRTNEVINFIWEKVDD
jgi:hypothetical protein